MVAVTQTRLLKATVFVFIATALGLGLNYVSGIIAARGIGLADFGAYSVALNLFGVVSVLSVLGLDSALLRFVAHDLAKEGVQGVGMTVSMAIGAALISGTLFAVASVLIIPLLSNFEMDQPHFSAALFTFAAAIPAYSGMVVVLAALQAVHDVRYRMTIRYLVEPLLRISLVLVALSIGAGLLGVALAFSGALWLSLFTALVVLQRHGGFTLNFRALLNSSARRSAKRLFHYSLPVTGGLVFSVISTRSALILVGFYLGAEEAGIYAAAFQTSAMLSLISQSVVSVSASHLSEQISKNRQDQVEHLYSTNVRWIFALAMPAVALFLSFPGEVLSLFGPKFDQGAVAFSILVVGQLINISVMPANQLLLLYGKSKWVMLNEACNGSTQLLLNVILIPSYGILGAAISSLVALFMVNLLRLVELKFVLRLRLADAGLIRITIVGMGLAGCLKAAVYFFDGANLFLSVVALVALYFPLLFFFGANDHERTAALTLLQRISSRTP